MVHRGMGIGRRNGRLQWEKDTFSSKLMVMLNPEMNTDYTTFSFSREDLKGAAEALGVLVDAVSGWNDLVLHHLEG